jgi:hypothetical protein
VAKIIGLFSPTAKVTYAYIPTLILPKSGFWAILSQTHLVALLPTLRESSFSELSNFNDSKTRWSHFHPPPPSENDFIALTKKYIIDTSPSCVYYMYAAHVFTTFENSFPSFARPKSKYLGPML